MANRGLLAPRGISFSLLQVYFVSGCNIFFSAYPQGRVSYLGLKLVRREAPLF